MRILATSILRMFVCPVVFLSGCFSSWGRPDVSECEARKAWSHVNIEPRIVGLGYPIFADEAYLLFHLKNSSSKTVRVSADALLETHEHIVIRTARGKIIGGLGLFPQKPSTPRSTGPEIGLPPHSGIWIAGYFPDAILFGQADGEYSVESSTFKMDSLHIKVSHSEKKTIITSLP